MCQEMPIGKLLASIAQSLTATARPLEVDSFVAFVVRSSVLATAILAVAPSRPFVAVLHGELGDWLPALASGATPKRDGGGRTVPLGSLVSHESPPRWPRSLPTTSLVPSAIRTAARCVAGGSSRSGR